MPSSAVIVYGIANCDSVKTARAWLAERGIDHGFHDYRKAGVDRTRLAAWVASLGWPLVLNRAGTSFRKLPEPDRRDLDERRAIALMMAQPAMIKRPVAEYPGVLLVGFAPDQWAQAFGE